MKKVKLQDEIDSFFGNEDNEVVDDGLPPTTLREISILSRIKHPNIV